AQRVPMNVHMLHINGCRKGLERRVVETVQGSHESQIFRDPLRQSLRQCLVLNSQRNVMAEQIQSFELVLFVERISLPAAQSRHPHQLASDLERRNAFEELRRNIPVGT